MGITKAKLQKLEQKIKSQLISNNSLKSVPRNWEEFVRLTTIRSGGEMVKFEPYDYQMLLVKLMQQHSNVVVVKSRQLGTTQAIVSKFLHDGCLNAASSSVCFMRNSDDVGSLSRRVKQMLEGLQEYVLPANDSVGYIKLKNLGDLYIKNSSKEGIRSLDSITNQLYDESAFIERIEQIYGASSAASALVGDSVSKIIVSTPSAKSGWYWSKLSENNEEDVEEICKRVASGELWRNLPGFYYWIDKAGVCKVVLHWRCHPIYSKIDKEYEGGYLAYRMKQDSVDEEIALREYDLRFIDSSVSVFTSEIVNKNAVGTTETERDNEATYYCGLDCSTFGSDYTVFTVLKFKNGKYSLVYHYRKRQETSELHIYKIGKIIKVFKPEKVAIETTGGVGHLYLEQLSREHTNTRFEAIHTSQDSKITMVSTLVLALEKEALEYPPNSPLIEECLSFRRQGNKLEAASGKHDDMLMSTCFALAISPFNKQQRYYIDVSKIKVVE
ncbi:MAG: Terminase-like family protein [Pelatocladus maniniholoensis HA4357-MV3]|jgi:phage terminase large subunit-like protein|uniref:Terminase-like family protein n=1 Tax=Pelatocladus maniniholoensis HA4357-MV3 TaxID=1117104 RepID=A0A9E3HFI8_9NOST|nr:Terminase-like family protein [Pelatocladus maniniholoensis HA4357-MV3]